MFSWTKSLSNFFSRSKGSIISDLPVSSDQNSNPYSAYANNPIVYRAVNLISSAVSTIPWKVSHNEVQVNSGPIYDLITKPNQISHWSEIIETIVQDLLVFGNAYIYISQDFHPLEISILRPFRVSLVPGKYGAPLGYRYIIDQEEQFIPYDQELPRILHIKMPNPKSEWYGMSPITSAINAITQHNLMATHNISTMKNGGKPFGCLIWRNKTSLSEKQRQEMRTSLQDMYQGVHNAGRIFVAEGDFDWKEMGIKPKDLDYNEGYRTLAIEITIALGVHPNKLGIREERLANYKESNIQFGEETVIPMIDRIIKSFNLWFEKIFQSDYKLYYDKNDIDSLIYKRELLWNILSKSNFISTNEKRALFGYEQR